VRGPIHSSRRRYAEYFRKRKRASAEERVAERTEARDKATASPRKRSFFSLFASFWSLMTGQRWRVVAALATLSVSTGLGLSVPYSSKIVIDYVLTDNPGPPGWPSWLTDALSIDPASEDVRLSMLIALGAAILVVSLVAAGVGLWGRWQCTRLTKTLQAMLRRRAFEHAVRLPLARISDLKSGGVASILRRTRATRASCSSA
jgi:ATP-binding cassette subfamily B protein